MLNNDIKDRGMKKWQGLMLTEHVTRIKEWKAEDNYVQQTLLDDWEQALIQEEIEVAYKRQCVAEVTVWRSRKIWSYVGKLTELNVQRKSLSVEGPFGHDSIPVADIVKVTCVD